MDVKELIGEVARRHNVLVDPTDPIFVAVTLNELLLGEHVHAVQAAVERAQTNIAAGSRHQVENAKQAATILMVDSAKYAAEQVRSAGAHLHAQLEQLVQGSAQAAQVAAAAAETHRLQSRWSAAVAVVCASIAVASTCAILLRGP
ncbi:MAG: hypothetical protein WCC48_14225 [Anaeromyxobacteraceae bacterium]